MSQLQPREVADYLTDQAIAQHHDQVLTEMEARAEDTRFPIVGRAVGRYLELVTRAIGARRVLELGSGFGYSAYWFARAVGEDGEVVATDADPDHATAAEGYLRRAGLWGRVRYRVGDAIERMAAEDGEFDVIHCDIDKDSYPAAFAAAAERIRVGGLYVCDNVLWDGRVTGLDVPAHEWRDGRTPHILAHNRTVATDPRFVSSIVPLRDGVLTALRIA